MLSNDMQEAHNVMTNPLCTFYTKTNIKNVRIDV